MKVDKSLIVFAVLGVVGILIAVGIYGGEGEEKVSPPTAAARIICMAPSVAECVFALGCSDRVVGVSSFCDYPPEAKEKVKLGGFANPDFERLLSLKPDLVIIQGQFTKIAEFCRREKIAVLRVEMSDIKTIYHDIMLLGEALGCGERAVQVCKDIRGSLEAVKAKVAGRKRPRVFFSLFRAPGSLAGISTIGGNTFLSELVEIAGGKDIFDDLEQQYPQVSKETLLRRQPEIIIEPCAGDGLTDEQRKQRLDDWGMLEALPAVKQGRIYFPAENLVFKPGPRIGETAAVLASKIHPEIASE